MTCCHGSGVMPWLRAATQLRMVGCHGRERLGRRDTIDQQPLPVHDMRRRVRRRERDAGRLDGRRVGGAAARIAAAGRRPGTPRQPRRRGGSGTGSADDMDALPCPDRSRRSGRRRDRPRCPPRTGSRGQPVEQQPQCGVGALPLVGGAIAVPEVSLAPRSRRHPRPPRTSGRPAWSAVPPVGPAMPVTETRERRAEAAPGALGHRLRHLGGHRAVGLDERRRDRPRGVA